MSDDSRLAPTSSPRPVRRRLRSIGVIAALAAASLVTILSARGGSAGPDPHAAPPPPAHGAPARPGEVAPRGPGAPPGATAVPVLHAPGAPGAVTPQHVPGAGHDSAQGHEHGASHEEAAHAHHDPKAPPEPINWYHGLLGPRQGATPNLLWRSPEEPPPFLATLINFGLLVYLFVHFGKKPLQQALIKRKDDITREMNDAQRIRQEAEKRLQEYETKIGSLNQELEKIRLELREQGARDRDRIVREAQDRATKLRADANYLLDQELQELRQTLVTETVDQAVRLASQMIAKNSTPSDHDRFAEVFLAQLKARQGHGAQKIEPDALVKGGSS